MHTEAQETHRLNMINMESQKLIELHNYVPKQMDKSPSTPRNEQITDEENFDYIA